MRWCLALTSHATLIPRDRRWVGPDVKPGKGRIEACLNSKRYYLNSMCAQRRVTYDAVPNKCAEDAAHLCTEPHMIDQVAHKVPCLRKHRNKVSQACWDSLLKLTSDGWEFLPNRFKHLSVDSPCTSALVRACGNIAPGFGALHQCVDRHWALLAEDCGLRPRETPENVPEVCKEDALVLCKHITNGNNRIHDCLWRFDGVRDDLTGKTLSKDCLSALILQSVSMDVECAADVSSLCGHDYRDKRSLVRCLHQHQEKLAHGCTTRRHHHLLSDDSAPAAPALHHNLVTGTHADGCAQDIRRWCAGLRAGHGLIHACLLENKDRLSPECRIPRGQVVNARGAVVAGREAGGEEAASAVTELKVVGAEQGDDNWSDVEHLAFENNDRDHDGSLSASELAAALVGRYERSISGDVVRHGKALRLLRRFDADGSGSIDVHEFHSMTQSAIGRQDPPAAAGESKLGGGEVGGQEVPHRQGGVIGGMDSGRSFKQRTDRNAFAKLVTSWYVLVPVSIGIAALVCLYRSSVRRSKKPSAWISSGHPGRNTRKSKSR